jgi:hypothetical protein
VGCHIPPRRLDDRDLAAEEKYWRQQWLLKGDAKTRFFHAFVNGGKCKCAILSLNSDNGMVTDKEPIQEMVYSFYRSLMGPEEPKHLGLSSNIWLARFRLGGKMMI